MQCHIVICCNSTVVATALSILNGFDNADSCADKITSLALSAVLYDVSPVSAFVAAAAPTPNKSLIQIRTVFSFC
jgi:hypothetical protein